MHKIILLVPQFPKLSETFILSKFVELVKSNWDVHVVCWQSPVNEWQHVDGMIDRDTIKKRVHLAWPQRSRWLTLLLLPITLLRCLIYAPRATSFYLQRGWKKFGPDIWRRLYLDAELILLRPHLIHFEFGALAPERMYLRELLACKVAVSFRGYDLNFVGLDHPNHYQPVWDHADALHLLGVDLWERAIRRGCPPDKPHALIPPAINLEFFAPAETRLSDREEKNPVAELHILSVGRLEWKKGYEHALQAVKLARQSGIDCRYRIIGDGEYYECLAFARHQLGQNEYVEFLGALSREGVREHLRWADVFLHASTSEGFCNAVIEAQAMGLPVICSDADGLRENVKDGLTGFVVPRRDPHAFAEKLVLLAKDPPLRQKMGNAGQERVRRLFQISDQISQFEQLYRKTLSGNF